MWCGVVWRGGAGVRKASLACKSVFVGALHEMGTRAPLALPAPRADLLVATPFAFVVVPSVAVVVGHSVCFWTEATMQGWQEKHNMKVDGVS